MKKLIAIFMVIASLTTMMCATTAYATSDIKVVVNDTMVAFPDAQPYRDDNNRTLIPVRFVTEAMGAEVVWNQATQTASISKNGITVDITIGKQDIKVTKDGSTSTVKMDTVAVNKESRTFVPIRFVSEALGAYVDYSSLYGVAEVVMPEEVTADEIKRLRSYPMNQAMNLENRNNEANAWWMDKEEYKSFTGNYWFSNSHFFLVTMEEKLGYEAKNQYTTTKVTADTNALDYARFAVQFAEDYIETGSYKFPNSTLTMCGYWTCGSASVQLRIDNSLCYQMICPPQSVVTVRGIMDYTVKTERGAKILAAQFGVENAEIGKTYSFDVEVLVSVNNLYYLDVSQMFYFDESGNAVKIATVPDVK